MMMEEISDDTNGESTFEFVSNKTEDIIQKGDVVSSTSEFSSNTVPLLPSTTASLDTAASLNTASVTPVPMYKVSSLPSVPLIPPQVPGMGQTPETQKIADKISYGGGAVTPQMYSTGLPSPSVPGYSPAIPTSPSAPVAFSAVSQPCTSPPMHQSYPPVVPQAELNLPMDDNFISSSGQVYQEGPDRGVWGWFRGNEFLNRVAEKAMHSVDSVITTLDPGMKEIIYSGGDISVIVASGSDVKVTAVREAFQSVFGKATVEGVPAQSVSIAPQPVGFSAGLKAAEERISKVRQLGLTDGSQAIVAVENFLVEVTPDKWFDIGCLLLQDPKSQASLQIYTQATPVASHFVMQAKEKTPADYPLGWSGFEITIGQILGPVLGVHHSEWHHALTGVSRREMLLLAAKTLAGMYKMHLRR